MPPTWDQTLAAIQTAIATASGFDTGKVIWEWQNADAPPLPYIAIGITAGITVGIDWLKKTKVEAWEPTTGYVVGDMVVADSGARTYSCIGAGLSAGSGGPTGTGTNIVDGTVHWKYFSNVAQIKSETQGVREISLELSCFTDSTADGSDAQYALELTKSALRLEGVRDLFTAVGISPFDPGPVGYLPEIVAVKFRGRATCSIRCYMPAVSATEFISSIERVSGSITYTGGSVTTPTTIDYEVP